MDSHDAIRHMVNDILTDNSADAIEKFNSLMATRVSDSIDIKKQELATTLYSKSQEEE